MGQEIITTHQQPQQLFFSFSSWADVCLGTNQRIHKQWASDMSEWIIYFLRKTGSEWQNSDAGGGGGGKPNSRLHASRQYFVTSSQSSEKINKRKPASYAGSLAVEMDGYMLSFFAGAEV